MTNNDDRDEDFLVDVLGTWIPECELIFYGLLSDSRYQTELYKLRNIQMVKPRDMYLDMCFFQAEDLIKYLASDTEEYADLPEDYIQEAVNMALRQYLYSPCSETAMRHAIMELMYQKFVHSVTLVYPWEPREMDFAYLRRITPRSILNKLNVTGGTIPQVIQSTGQVYTTIVTNSLEDIRTLVADPVTNNVYTTLFLLRNHSGNMNVTKIPDESEIGYHLDFHECDTRDVLAKMIDQKTGIPISPMRFGRFEPQLFNDMERRITPFISK